MPNKLWHLSCLLGTEYILKCMNSAMWFNIQKAKAAFMTWCFGFLHFALKNINVLFWQCLHYVLNDKRDGLMLLFVSTLPPIMYCMCERLHSQQMKSQIGYNCPCIFFLNIQILKYWRWLDVLYVISDQMAALYLLHKNHPRVILQNYYHFL